MVLRKSLTCRRGSTKVAELTSIDSSGRSRVEKMRITFGERLASPIHNESELASGTTFLLSSRGGGEGRGEDATRAHAWELKLKTREIGNRKNISGAISFGKRRRVLNRHPSAR